MFTKMIVVAVTPFSGTSSPDKNGKAPVMLQCIAGTMPNRNVLSGTVAERAGFEVGKTYLAQVRENGIDEIFGPDFSFIKVKELMTGKDIADTIASLGNPEILTVSRPQGFEEIYKRKTTAVEGIKNERIREGLYTPAVSTSYEHKTADTIIEGISIKNADPQQQEITPEDLERGNPTVLDTNTNKQ